MKRWTLQDDKNIITGQGYLAPKCWRYLAFPPNNRFQRLFHRSRRARTRILCLNGVSNKIESGPGPPNTGVLPAVPPNAAVAPYAASCMS
jgi:hypothetical protein